MTEDSIRVTAGRPTSGTAGAGGPHRRRGLPVPSELIVLALTVLALLIAAAVSDEFDATVVWGYVTLVSGAFILSRGLTKRGHADDGL